jgi:hypothetical protein
VRRELGSGTARLPSHGAVVQRHPGPPAATRLSMLSLYSRSRSWALRCSSPDAAAVRSVCAFVSSSRLVFAQSNLAIFLSFFPFPALVFCVCGHVLIATHRSTSSGCTSPRVLRIGLGGAGNRRGLARCANASLSISHAIFILHFLLLFLLPSRPVFPLPLSTSSTPRPIHTPLDSLTSTLQLDRSRASTVLKRRSTRAQYRVTRASAYQIGAHRRARTTSGGARAPRAPA